MKRVAILLLAATTVFVCATELHAQTILWMENFDGVVAPDLPAGWVNSAAGFETSSSVTGPLSGANNLMHKGTLSGHISTPPFDLTLVTDGSVAYNGRRTGSYNADAMRVTASIDGGATYPVIVMDNGEALPQTDSDYQWLIAALPSELIGEPDVRFRFEALGGSSASSSIRIDDLQLEGTGEIPSNRFGFRVAADTLNLSGSSVSVPLDLDLGLTDAGMQGLQFTVAFDDGKLQAEDVMVAHSAITGANWQLDTEVVAGEVRAVLIGHETESLPSGAYAPLLTLEFAVTDPSATTETTLTLQSVIASEADPLGTDLPILLSENELHLLVEPSEPVFKSDADTLDFGIMQIETTAERTLMVSNPDGTGALQIDTVWSDNTIFSVTPENATIAPADSLPFTVSASPLLTDVGDHSAILHFSHNAGTGIAEIVLLVTVVSGRGDINQDLVVDIVDLVWGVDIVLERLIPTPEQLGAADLHPFPSGDARVDVRDLTVLTRAIAGGIWPDDVPLGPASIPAMKTEMADTGGELTFRLREGGLSLSLETTRSVRAFHAVFSIPGATMNKQARLRVEAPPSMTAFSTRRHGDRAFSVLMYRADGGGMEPGTYTIGEMTIDTQDVPSLRIEQAIAVGNARNRMRLGSHVVFESASGMAPEDASPLLGALYPVPYATGTDLHIPVHSVDGAMVDITIFNVLGRIVGRISKIVDGHDILRWNGKNRLGEAIGPGLYVLRASTVDQSMTASFIVSGRE